MLLRWRLRRRFRSRRPTIPDPECRRQAKIGSTSFTVLHHDSTEEIKGETRYLNGERDSEDTRLHLSGSASAPTLDTYEHSFFKADGSILMLDTLDAKSGDASYTSYWSGGIRCTNRGSRFPLILSPAHLH